MPITFDPNAPAAAPTTQPEWATYVEHAWGKRPTKFKTHSALHHATAAVDAQIRNGVVLYHHENSQWVEVLRVEHGNLNGQPMEIKGTDKCERCGLRMCDTEDYRFWKPGWAWAREKGRIANPPRLVKMCGRCKFRK